MVRFCDDLDFVWKELFKAQKTVKFIENTKCLASKGVQNRKTEP